MPVRSLAILCSAHGFGHLTRQLATGRHLRALGVEPVIFTAAPAEVVHETLPDAEVVGWRTDVGLAQPDSLRTDLDRTLALLEERCSERAVDRLAEALARRSVAGVVADIPPTGLEAARRAGLGAVAVGNFDWAWIYRHYPPLRSWAERFARWQAPHPGLALSPGPGLAGFARTRSCGLVGRQGAPHPFEGPERHVLVSFGGLGLADLERRLPRLTGVRWVVSAPMPPLDRSDCTWIEGVPYPSLVAGSDAVLTKPGYGILAEASLAGTPVAWLTRPGWPESPFLAAAHEARGDVEVTGTIAEALEQLWSRPRPVPAGTSGAGALAARILDELGLEVVVEGPVAPRADV